MTTIKPTLHDVEKLAEQHDARVEIANDPGSKFHDVPAHRIVWIDLPEGKHWTCNDTNMILRQSNAANKAAYAELYAELISDMEDGVEDCPHGGCSQCD